jgi:hypothetical protein
MNIIKISCISLVIFLTGCQGGGSVIKLAAVVTEQNKINNLPRSQRCKHMREDLIQDCKDKAKKEFDELVEAMKNEH